MKKVLLLNIPVLHKGYLKLFDKYKKEVSEVFIFDGEMVGKSSEFKEIRTVDPSLIIRMINSLRYPFRAKLLSKVNAGKMGKSEFVAVNDYITNNFLKRYYPKNKTIFEDVFLRWDEGNVQSEKTANYNKETTSTFDRRMMKKANEAGGKSTDWWRRVGCVVVKNKKVLITSFNEHFPKNDIQYAEGDPRDFIKAGKLGFLASSAHAEQMAIAKAANKGISLKGADMYVSTYPCPACAKITAAAGIKRCYFQGGNSYLDVEAVFKATGLKAILVKDY